MIQRMAYGSFNETNVPTGTVVYGPNGEILKYVLSYNQTTKTGWIAQWNNTEDQKGLEIATGTGASAYEWRPIGKVVDMSTAYDWNITFTGDITNYTGVGPSISYVFYNDVMIGISGPAYNGASPPQNGAQNPYTVWAIDLKPATRGHLLWCDQIDLGAGNSTTYIGSVDPISRTWTLIWKEKLCQTGYSLDTGAKVWGPTAPVAQFDYYGQSDFTAYGNQ